MSTLSELRTHSTLVADTADFELLKKHPVTDATTNPSLILAASSTAGYAEIMQEGKTSLQAGKPMDRVIQRILARAGHQILQIVPGRVSAEVDARLSFDTQATIAYAYRLIEEFTEFGIDKARVLIKIASTWEGLQAAKYLEEQGIHCNMTLIFHRQQALVAAESGATLISPFVGRILDFYTAAHPEADYSGAKDPGVISVRDIYQQLKQRGFATQVMAASFRNTDEIMQLAGVDLLTIAPSLLDTLAQDTTAVPAMLTAPNLGTVAVAQTTSTAAQQQSAQQQSAQQQASFLWHMNNDPMAHHKLADGIRRFAADQVLLETTLSR